MLYPASLTFMISVAVLSVLALKNKSLFNSCILYPATIRKGRKVHTVLSSALVHVSYPHLIINMAVLYYFGTELESDFFVKKSSSFLFLSFLAASVLLSNLMIVALRSSDVYFSTAGSSTLTHSVLAAYLLAFPLKQLPVFPVFLTNLHILLFYILGSLVLLIVQKKPKIDHLSHLAGLLSGSLIFSAFFPGATAASLEQALRLLGF